MVTWKEVGASADRRRPHFAEQRPSRCETAAIISSPTATRRLTWEESEAGQPNDRICWGAVLGSCATLVTAPPVSRCWQTSWYLFSVDGRGSGWSRFERSLSGRRLRVHIHRHWLPRVAWVAVRCGHIEASVTHLWIERWWSGNRASKLCC